MTNTNLTLFSTCKPLKGKDAIHQMNGIGSWRQLGFPVLLLGQDLGVTELAQKHQCKHIPDIEVNENGVPYVSALFEAAFRESSTEFIGYVNSDIILTANYKEQLLNVISLVKGFFCFSFNFFDTIQKFLSGFDGIICA